MMYLIKHEVNSLKVIFLAIYILVLSSCANLDTNRIAPGYSDAYKALKEYFLDDKKFISNQLISQIPYASMKVKIGRGQQGLLILESKTKFKEYWVSADNVYLEIEQGRIVASKGLENNLRENINQINFKELLRAKKFDSIVYSSFDFPRLNNLKLKSNIKVIGKQSINLFSGTKELTLIEEVLINDYLGWSVLNKYWVDDSGYCWKSEQNISPLLPTFYLEVAKKPA